MNIQQKIAQYRKYLVDAKLNSMLRKQIAIALLLL